MARNEYTVSVGDGERTLYSPMGAPVAKFVDMMGDSMPTILPAA